MGEKEHIYGPNDHIPFGSNILMALQLVATSIATIIAPPIIIADSLSLSPSDTSFLVSASLLCAAIGTFIQTKRIGLLGTGLLVVEGANFTFVGLIIAAGIKMIANKTGGGMEIALAQKETLGTIFTGLIIASMVAAVFSLLLKYIQKRLSPVVLGTMIVVTGLCLIKVGTFAAAGGELAIKNGSYAEPSMIITALIVLAVTIVCQISKIKIFSMASILWGIIAGIIAAYFFGILPELNFSGSPIISTPRPMAYGWGFDWAFTLNMSILSILLVFVSSGIITSSFQASGVSIKGPEFSKKIKGGVFAQAFDSAISGVLCGIPLTPYAQVNTIISFSKISSRVVGYTVSALFFIAFLFPAVSKAFSIIPQSVLGGAAVFLFAGIAVSGFEMIFTQKLSTKDMIIVISALCGALSVEFYPDILSHCPSLVADLFASGIITGSSIAVLLQFVLPEPKMLQKKDNVN